MLLKILFDGRISGTKVILLCFPLMMIKFNNEILYFFFKELLKQLLVLFRYYVHYNSNVGHPNKHPIFLWAFSVLVYSIGIKVRRPLVCAHIHIG